MPPPPCDPNLLFQAAVAHEQFDPNDPSYSQPGMQTAGAYGSVCLDDWAIAGVSRPNVGTTDGLTLFHYVGGWTEVTTLGGQGVAPCALVAQGVPADLAARFTQAVGAGPGSC